MPFINDYFCNMKISKFIVAKEIGGEGITLLYHTLRTTLVTLPCALYNEVFIQSDFTDTDAVKQLLQMGFLIDDGYDEIKIVEKLREADSNEKAQTVTIFSTNKCNARCYYCFEEGIVQSDMEKSTAEQIVRFIVSFFPYQKLQIQWFGGEPLMAMDNICYITEALKDKGYVLSTHITTNGSFLTEKIIEYFKDNYEPVSFQITIDDIGINYGNIKHYINIPKEDAFNQIINACNLVLDNDLFLALRINYLPSQIEKAKSIYNQLCNIFVDKRTPNLRIYLAPITLNEDCSSCNDGGLDTDTFIDLLKFQYGHQTGNYFSDNQRTQLLQSFYLKPKASFCGATRKYNLVITAEGKIYKCHRFVKYDHDKYVVGDVWKGIDFSKDSYCDFTDSIIKDDDCKLCRALPICQEGCYAVRELYGKKRSCSLSAKLEECLLMYWNVIRNK